MRFIDEIQISLSSGHGGPGKVSFRREAMTPRGGPDGGDGGRGGDVIVKVATNLSSLVDYKPRKKYGAENGAPGEAANRSGAAGKDYILWVPPGTLIRDQNGEVLVDMTSITEHTLLQGGRGGKGNHFFKTSVNQAPEHAQPGEPGADLDVTLELKLIADVGIIGFPNAGKSTLISRISAAKPKIADYPFTTLTPNLGVVKAGEFKSFVVADIPGLIRGAHQGAGLGIQFLKHIERTRLFIHLIDASEMSGQDPWQAYQDIQYELEMYDNTNKEKDGFFPLGTRPQFIVLNKIETISSEQQERLLKQFEKKLGRKPLLISAVTGKNIDKLIFEISSFLFQDTQDVKA